MYNLDKQALETLRRLAQRHAATDTLARLAKKWGAL